MSDKTDTRFTDMPALDYGKIKDEVRNLPEAVFNKLDREWPDHWPSEQGLRDLLQGLVRASQYSYRAGLYLVADDPDPQRKPEFAIALPPLVRGLLDTLVTLIFLFDDLRGNSRWYFRAGWRELAEYRSRVEAMYGDDPLWTEWLRESAEGLEKMRTDFGISKGEAADPKTALPYWPIPTQMVKVENLSKSRAEFIEFLVAAYYRELSQDAHLSWPGFLRRAAPLLDRGADLGHLRQSSFQVALIMLIAILTEIDSEGGLGLAPRLGFLWGLLSRYHWLGESMYERRYERLLGGIG
jgi:hypothetical protein